MGALTLFRTDCTHSAQFRPCRYFKIDKFTDLLAKDFDRAIAALKKKASK